MSGITIIGTGRHVPGAPVLNDALARVMETSDEWIQARTGIQQRHFARDGQGASDLGVEAAKKHSTMHASRHRRSTTSSLRR